MRTAAILFAVVAVMLTCYPATAQDDSKKAFYQNSIDQCIAKFERKALMMASPRTGVRRDAAIASMKAAFYKTHRGSLIDQMVAQDLDVKGADVDYFLIKSFGDFYQSDLAQALADRFEMMSNPDTSRPSRVVMKEPE